MGMVYSIHANPSDPSAGSVGIMVMLTFPVGVFAGCCIALVLRIRQLRQRQANHGFEVKINAQKRRVQIQTEPVPVPFTLFPPCGDTPSTQPKPMQRQEMRTMLDRTTPSGATAVLSVLRSPESTSDRAS